MSEIPTSILSLSSDRKQTLGKALEIVEAELSQELEANWWELFETTDPTALVSSQQRGDGTLAELSRTELESRVVALETDAEELRAQVEWMGGRGIDWPPCWPVRVGDRVRPEYAFRVVIHEDTLDVEGIWPETRDDEAAEIPGFVDLQQAGLTMSDFESRARPILDWSDSQNPRCRHYVRLVDDTISKVSFKAKLLMVEGYFYKALVDS